MRARIATPVLRPAPRATEKQLIISPTEELSTMPRAAANVVPMPQPAPEARPISALAMMEPLGAARRALAAHLDALRQATAEVRALEQPRARLRQAQEAAAKAEAELSAIAARETAAMTSWAQDGCTGPMPQPLTIERRAAAERFASARATAAAATAAHGKIEERVATASQAVANLNAKTPALVREVLLVEANAIAAQADKHLAAASALLGELAALQRYLGDRQTPDDPSSYVMARVPMPALDQTLRDVALRDMKHVLASVEAWGVLAQALAHDASATLKE